VIDCNELKTETPRMRKYGESKTTRIMMATVITNIQRNGQNLLFSSLLSQNLKMKIYKTIILPVVVYGCET